MTYLPLAISPTEIVVFLSLTIVLYVISLFLMSKTMKSWKFFVWLLIIIFIPFIGSISYLIYHLANMNYNKKKNVYSD